MPVSYTHLDVYKRQGLRYSFLLQPALARFPRSGTKVCLKIHSRHLPAPLPVSYTHLDVYKRQPWLLAFIITMVLIQAGRLNIELDYDSLHYGLRSAFVLDNGKGIYENLGMINLVYTYSKGLEVLALPLCGTPTYGFVLAFSLWMAAAVLVLAASMVGRCRGLGMGLFAAAVLSSIPGIMNMAATAKSDIITLLHLSLIHISGLR